VMMYNPTPMRINRMSTRRGEDLRLFFLGPMYILTFLTWTSQNQE